jgi:hypothetical protein
MIPYETVFAATEDYIKKTFQYCDTHTGTFVNRIYECMYKALGAYYV